MNALTDAEEQGTNDSDGEEFDEHIGVPDDAIDEGATPGNAKKNNLRPRVPAPLRFNDAMDEPHNDKTYYPPTQLINADKHNLRAVVFEHMPTQLTTPGAKKIGKEEENAFLVELLYMSTQMTAKAGIK